MSLQAWYAKCLGCPEKSFFFVQPFVSSFRFLLDLFQLNSARFHHVVLHGEKVAHILDIIKTAFAKSSQDDVLLLQKESDRRADRMDGAVPFKRSISMNSVCEGIVYCGVWGLRFDDCVRWYLCGGKAVKTLCTYKRAYSTYALDNQKRRLREQKRCSHAAKSAICGMTAFPIQVSHSRILPLLKAKAQTRAHSR